MKKHVKPSLLTALFADRDTAVYEANAVNAGLIERETFFNGEPDHLNYGVRSEETHSIADLGQGIVNVSTCAAALLPCLDKPSLTLGAFAIGGACMGYTINKLARVSERITRARINEYYGNQKVK